MAKYYVWLDAGHSKATPGKRNTVANPDFFEYEFNNDIAVKRIAQRSSVAVQISVRR